MIKEAMMKKLLTISAVLLMIVTMSACTKKEPEIDLPEMIPDELCGLYTDSIAGRANVSVQTTGITVDWAGSAFEKAHYELPTDYDGENGRINYAHGVLKNRTYTSDGNFTEETVYEDGTGYFEITEDGLIWHDDKQESDLEPTVLVRADQPIGYPNPWTYTTDLAEAITVSGIDFDPPLPLEGYELQTYGALKDQLIEAQYVKDGIKLTVRKSAELSGQDLSGDYYDYPATWTLVLKGVEAVCYGDEEGHINLAYFDNGTYNYSVTVHSFDETVSAGASIDADDLNSLIMSMQ